MTEFPPLPGDMYEYQNEFTYNLWTPNTRVYFTNVQWDASYRDVVRFTDSASKNAYFGGLKAAAETLTIDRMLKLNPDTPLKINIPFAKATLYNYAIVELPASPAGDAAMTYYYFINGTSFLAPNTTAVTLQLDAWQTYYERLQFGRCFVQAGHIGVANSNAVLSPSKPVALSTYLTVPEGLDVGSEYQSRGGFFYNFASKRAPMVVIQSTAELAGDLGTVDNPKLNTATGNTWNGVPSGCMMYAILGKDLNKFMTNLSKYPWVSQCITAITLMPGDLFNESPWAKVLGVDIYNPKDMDGGSQTTLFTVNTTNFFTTDWLLPRYRHLVKFCTFPYSFVEATAFNGSSLVLKLEYIDNTGTLPFMMRANVNNPSPRMLIFPSGYLKGSGGDYPSGDNEYHPLTYVKETKFSAILPGEFIDTSIIIDNFPQFPLVNNSYIQYMASTAHSRQFQYDSASWAQQKALAGADLSYGQAGESMTAQNALMNEQMQAMDRSREIQNNALIGNTVAGMAQSVVSGAMGGPAGLGAGALGAAGTGIGALIQQQANYDTNASQKQLLANTTGINQNLSGYMRDTNLQYAQMAARGDYRQSIAGINATVQDAKLRQPSTSGQYGGDAFNIAAGLFGVQLKLKYITPNAQQIVGEHWLRYGYMVQKYLVPPANLHCMQNFTYWQMKECSLKASKVPEVFKEAVRGIFEKGVTVWRNPDNIGTLDIGSNPILDGISY